jgi:prevent-host-death family protein
MRHVSATDAKQSLGQMIEAAQREPVVIRKQKRDVAVLLSMRDYERLTAANIEAFQRFCDLIGERAQSRGLTESKLEELLGEE